MLGFNITVFNCDCLRAGFLVCLLLNVCQGFNYKVIVKLMGTLCSLLQNIFLPLHPSICLPNPTLFLLWNPNYVGALDAII